MTDLIMVILCGVEAARRAITETGTRESPTTVVCLQTKTVWKCCPTEHGTMKDATEMMDAGVNLPGLWNPLRCRLWFRRPNRLIRQVSPQDSRQALLPVLLPVNRQSSLWVSPPVSPVSSRSGNPQASQAKYRQPNPVVSL